MRQPQAPLIAREGFWFILGAIFLLIGLSRAFGIQGFLAVLPLLLLLVLIFRDPQRDVPSVPLAVVSPVDGRVTSVSPTDRGVLHREEVRITIRVNNFGAYTVRSPIEGKVLSLRENAEAGSRLSGVSGLWVQNEANDDVVLLFRGPPVVGKPKGFVRYGERIGQGQRCAFVRLARFADIYVPVSCRLRIKKGDRVRSGASVLGNLIHK